MSEVVWSSAEWPRAEFGGCELGDRRRVERAVTYAEQAVAHPDGSTPEQTESWSDCKAAYRLTMLRSLRKRPIVSIRDFVRELAGLGGFLMHKGDGEPGCLTLWRGLNKLILCLRGHHARK